MRKIININAGWQFAKNTPDFPAQRPESFEAVDLPHSWNATDGQDGGNDYFRGTCVYTSTITADELTEGNRHYLEIQGANSSAAVYVNGEKLSEHHGGYSTWRVDLTGKVNAGSELAITVDNTPNETVYPQMADFTFYGGLYRNVNLISVPETHFDLEYYGAPGIKITPAVEGNDARVEVEVYSTALSEDQTYIYTLYDREENELDRIVSTEKNVVFEIKDVHLWNGKKDPYLYCCEAEIALGEEILDNVCSRFGCRTFKIDPENGFILNGEEYPLRGVSRHQDRLGIGNALLPEHHEEDMALILEMGATTIRLAHYQHDQYFYDLCDEKGLVIWAEIPYISKHMPTARENTITQMKELVAQNYNHPSIVVWGLSNEISIGGSNEDLLENHRILNNICHEMDKTRLTTIAAVSMCKMSDPYLLIPDVVSYNHYFGWYGGDTSMNGPWFDKFHATHPTIPIGCSEYGCEALNWHNSDPRQGDYTEEYQAYYHEELIKQLFTRKYLWATHVWNMFDFGADARAEGGENGQNHKGLVTMDRKYKKDSFYAYKAWLVSPEDDPFVHVCSKRYVDRVEDVTKVTVYSNLPEVELFVNGESVGKKTSSEHFFYFDVKNEGETTIVAKAGDCMDEAKIRKVDSFNEEYRLVEQGVILNWFDVEEKPGRLSLNSKMGDVISTFRGKLIFVKLMGKMLGGKGKKKGEKKAKPMGFEINDDMIAMMNGFTVLRLLTMAGGMMNAKFTKEDFLKLNKKLNKIKAPKKKNK